MRVSHEHMLLIPNGIMFPLSHTIYSKPETFDRIRNRQLL